nr:host specificity factor TipJ family phage tail protein [Desulfobulbus rhabdoformis]
MEVGGQELDTDWVTYVVNPSGTGVYIIEYDIAFTGGLIRYTDEGKRQSRSVTVETEVRTIDEHGEGVSEWTTFHSRKYKATSKDPLFYTNKIGAPLGNDRYEFRIRRTGKESSSAQIVERCSVAGLRGFAGLHPAVDGVTMLECKIKATKQLNGEVSSKIGVRATRMLYPVTATGFGAVKEGTRSVADAVAYIVTADNGGKQDDSILVWEEMYALKTLFESEGFFFDWGFTSRSSVMDAAAKAARCAMAVPYTPGGLFCLVADRVQASTTLTFTGATAIDKGSLSITHSFHTPDSPDHVLVTYTDPVTWQPTTVTCVTVGGGNETPYEITLDGCTDREQAYKVGMRAWKELLLTTTGVTWTTGLMGHLPTLFSWVNVGEETVDFGQTGVIVSSEAGYIWFSEPVDFQGQAEGWLMVQLPDGTGGGPYTVHPTNYAHCVAGAIPGLRTLKDDAHKATPYVFGPVSEDIHVVRITSIAPGGRDKIELGGEVVNVEVYDLSDAPPTPGSPIVAGDPLISVDVAYEGLDDDGFTRHLLLTWSGSADTFLVEVDDGSGYATVEDNYSGFSLSHDIVTTSATVRVTPYQSDGTTLDTDHQLTASYTRVPPPTGLTYTIDESEDKVTLTWNEVANAKYYQVGLYVGDEERISVIAESTEYSTYIYAMNNMGAYYGCTVRVTAFVGAIESDPTSVNINLHGALAAPVVEIDTTAAGVVYLHWEGINAGTYYRPVIGWTYRVVNYHVYVGSYAGFDPLTEGTLLYSTTSIEVTHRPDVTIPFAHYYKVAASISTYPNPTYLNFSNTVVFAVSDGTAPAAPSAPVLQLTLASAVMINWSGVSGASGYKVYVGATVDFNPETEGAEVYSGSNAYATISLDLTSPYAYYVKVASFDAYFSDVGDINFSSSLEISG